MQTYTWQKSSYSVEGANCLYVGSDASGSVLLCESDEPQVVLAVGAGRLRGLLGGVKSRQLGADFDQGRVSGRSL